MQPYVAANKHLLKLVSSHVIPMCLINAQLLRAIFRFFFFNPPTSPCKSISSFLVVVVVLAL